MLYASHNAAAGAALGGGHLADRAGVRLVFCCRGSGLPCGLPDLQAGPHAPWLLLAGFLLAGTGIIGAETSESTLVARQLPERLRGNGFG